MGQVTTQEVQLKKTNKIISNKPVDSNEFSYFKKDQQKKKEEKPKPRIETDEDLNIFANKQNKKPTVN